MAWSWSHTYEAYLYAHSQLYLLDRDTLLEIAAEWRMHDKHPDNDAAWADQWPKALAFIRSKFCALPNASIAEYVWKRAYEQQTCDNGGWNAWMCPYGCGPHCVDFSPENEKFADDLAGALRLEGDNADGIYVVGT
jgi:hypothetical protein